MIHAPEAKKLRRIVARAARAGNKLARAFEMTDQLCLELVQHMEKLIGKSMKGKKKEKKKGRCRMVGECFTKPIAVAQPTPIERCLLPGLAFAPYLGACMERVGGAVLVYEALGSRLAGKAVSTRGSIFEAAGRQLLEAQGQATEDATQEERAADGSKLDKKRKSHDFWLVEGAKGVKAEMKGARFKWDSSSRRWWIEFQGVKIGKFKRLFLCFEDVDRLRFFEWDGVHHIYESAKVEGRPITIKGPSNVSSFEAAREAILAKVLEHHTPVGEVLLSDPAYDGIFRRMTAGEEARDGCPLAPLAPKPRGNAAEQLTRIVLKMLGQPTQDAERGKDRNGAELGKASTPNDFRVERDGSWKTAENKSATMYRDTSHERWELPFQNVKADKHELLFLTFLTRNAAHILEYAGENGRGGIGVRTGEKGEEIRFTAARGASGIPADDPDAAEDYLLRNMIWCGATYLARVAFTPDDARRVAAICTARAGGFLPSPE